MSKTVRMPLGRMLWATSALLFFSFLLLPLVVLIAVSFNPTSMSFPPTGFTFRWYWSILDRPDFLHAAWASTVIASLTAFLSTSAGVLAALWIDRNPGKVRNGVSFVLLSPLFIPPVIVALSLFQLLFLAGILNNLVVLVGAHVAVTLPYPMRNVLAQLVRFDRRLEEAAMSVGATPAQAFRKVTLPLLKSSIAPSLIVTFVLSWNNYTVSVFLAGKDWVTLPLQLRAYLQYQYEPFIAAISTVLIVASAILLITVERAFGVNAVNRR